MLSRLPPPSAQDIAARTARAQINRTERWSLLARYGTGLTLLLIMYLAVTVLRSIRADFATEIWSGLGRPAQPSTFTQSEILVVAGVLIANGSAVFIRDNRRAFFMALVTCAIGFILVTVSLVGRRLALLDGFGFMVLVGLGLYLPYVAMHTTIFERLLAMTRDRGNVGFLMYVADSVGYLGYVAVMLLRETLRSSVGDHLQFFTLACWLTCGVSIACLALSWRYFSLRCPDTKLAVIIEATA